MKDHRCTCTTRMGSWARGGVGGRREDRGDHNHPYLLRGQGGGGGGGGGGGVEGRRG